jgi:cell filamentation protein
MYESSDDPYCYPGTSVLKNRLDIRDPAALSEFEALITAQRADEPLPLARLDVDAYRAIHRHLFGDLYEWAGEYRTIRISKGASAFCYPEHIEREMARLFESLADEDWLADLAATPFAPKAAHVLAELNAIHPFREGNGRTQNVFLGIMADRAGHSLEFARLDPPAFLTAMIESFTGREEMLANQIRSLMSNRSPG